MSDTQDRENEDSVLQAEPQVDLERAAVALTKAMQSHTKERQVEQFLAEALRCMGLSPVVGQPVGTREADIFVPERQLVLEVKASGKARPQQRRRATKQKASSQPDGSDSPQGLEAQKEQLDDYVGWLADDDRERHGPSRHGWWGVLTDGKTGFVYKYDNRGRNPQVVASASWPTVPDDPHTVLSKLQDYPLAQVTGKPWAGDNLYAMAFAPLDKEITELLRSARRDLSREVYQREVDTKFKLWLDQMEASGLAPTDVEDQRMLFARHSFLVAVAKCVVATLQGLGAPTAANQFHGIGSGFTSWLTADWGTGSHPGIVLVQAIWDAADRFDWRMRQGDVLRNLYQDCIPKADRRLYGEYYTPDWLAEMLTERVLDNRWLRDTCEVALNAHRTGDYSGLRGVGVLDPTCGSGTFLYQAARALATHDYWHGVGATKQEIADSVALVVLGIDIHPVAVEMARATVLRALPAVPEEPLGIAQGDSLLIDRGQGTLDFGTVVRESPGGTLIHIPQAFIQHLRTPMLIEELVAAADRGDAVPPELLPVELRTAEMQQLYDELRAVCAAEGNSVWAWWLRSMLHPHQVAQRKVNRVLSNPPWVVMSTIRNPRRKEQMIVLAQQLEIWPGGRLANRFDICALIITVVERDYLSSRSTRAAYLTNRASLTAGPWAKFREVNEKRIRTTIDFGALRAPPFTGAKSAALLTGEGKRTAQQELVNRSAARIRNEDSWSTNRARVSARQPQVFRSVIKPSPYLDEKHAWHLGATMVPYCLLRLQKEHTHRERKRTIGKTTPSQHYPWANVGSQDIDVPSEWVQEVMNNANLHPFAVRAIDNEFIVPCRKRQVITDAQAKVNPYWQRAERIYQTHKGRGANSPATLLQRVNFHNTANMGLARIAHARHVLYYNNSGQHLKAAMTTPMLSDAGVYYRCLDNQDEGHYLACILNAACMQPAYQAARESDRHFALHIWRKIPIPRYDPTANLHQHIASCHTSAAALASGLLDDNYGTLKQDKIIREALYDTGAMAQMDKLVRRLLAAYCV